MDRSTSNIKVKSRQTNKKCWTSTWPFMNDGHLVLFSIAHTIPGHLLNLCAMLRDILWFFHLFSSESNIFQVAFFWFATAMKLRTTSLCTHDALITNRSCYKTKFVGILHKILVCSERVTIFSDCNVRTFKWGLCTHRCSYQTVFGSDKAQKPCIHSNTDQTKPSIMELAFVALPSFHTAIKLATKLFWWNVQFVHYSLNNNKNGPNKFYFVFVARRKKNQQIVGMPNAHSLKWKIKWMESMNVECKPTVYAWENLNFYQIHWEAPN